MKGMTKLGAKKKGIKDLLSLYVRPSAFSTSAISGSVISL